MWLQTHPDVARLSSPQYGQRRIFISLGSNERVVIALLRAGLSISMASIAPHNSDRVMKVGRQKGAKTPTTVPPRPRYFGGPIAMPRRWPAETRGALVVRQ